MEDEMTQPQKQDEGSASSADRRKELRDALLYTHSRLNNNTSKILETASFLYALIELLSERGGIAIEELDARRKVVGLGWRRSSAQKAWARCFKNRSTINTPSKRALRLTAKTASISAKLPAAVSRLRSRRRTSVRESFAGILGGRT